MFSDFPSLHPLIVHFPIVLILLSVPFQAATTWKSWEQIRWTTLLIMACAFLSSFAASTVFHAMPSSDAPKTAMDIFDQHEMFAQYTLWMSGFTFVLKLIGDFYKLYRRSYDGVVLTSAIITAVFLSITGHHGARLTHVAGVGPMGKYLMEDHGIFGGGHQHTDNEHKEEMNGIDMKGMNHKEEMKGMDMKDMNQKEEMKGIDMKGMNHKEEMKGMDMKDMNHKEEMKATDMKGMNHTQEMKGMDMTQNPMDTFQFEDNNPAFKKNKK